MSTGENRRPADEAINGFIRHLASRDFSITTRRIRRHFLDEYLQHVQEAAGTVDISAGELMEPARAAAWLADAADGKTRTRNTHGGPDAAAYSNSMRVRIDSYNAFAEFLCLPDRYDRQPPAAGDYLDPADTERLLHNLAVRRPIHANAATAIRTAAVAALVADTGRNVPELARLNVSALHLDGEARVDLTDGSCRLGGATVQILNRWLDVRAAIVAELEGSDPGYLWIPTKPGRPRGGRPPVKPGLSRAAVRTLHAAHRTLVSQVRGSPLRPGAFRVVRPSNTRPGPMGAPAPSRTGAPETTTLHNVHYRRFDERGQEAGAGLSSPVASPYQVSRRGYLSVLAWMVRAVVVAVRACCGDPRRLMRSGAPGLGYLGSTIPWPA